MASDRESKAMDYINWQVAGKDGKRHDNMVSGRK